MPHQKPMSDEFVMSRVSVYDTTLRDGNHAVQHQLSVEQIATYCRLADQAGIPTVEVGHGNGIGASSLQVGIARETDQRMIAAARANLSKSKLAIHAMPGFATIERDLEPALDAGVDVVRVATHCTEADICERHIQFVRNAGAEAVGGLMMSHMADASVLLEQARKLRDYGATTVVLFDSAGAYFPQDVVEKVGTIAEAIDITVGFHAHNNLGLGIANAIAAAQAGAKILDGCINAFGAGAGNAQLEVLVAVLERCGFETGIDLYAILDAASTAAQEIVPEYPIISPDSIVSGLAGVFSGFVPHVKRVAVEYRVDSRDILFELGRRGVVGGQEDLIVEVASQLARGASRVQAQ